MSEVVTRHEIRFIMMNKNIWKRSERAPSLNVIVRFIIKLHTTPAIYPNVWLIPSVRFKSSKQMVKVRKSTPVFIMPIKLKLIARRKRKNRFLISSKNEAAPIVYM